MGSSEAEVPAGGGEALPLEGVPAPTWGGSPSRLTTFLDCPRRYRLVYLDRPRPERRAQRAHTAVGVTIHNALRDWWDLSVVDRTPSAGARLVREGWSDVGFLDLDQSARHRSAAMRWVADYLAGVDPHVEPLGVERSVAFVDRTRTLQMFGRIDRLDDRDGELVVVDYKTGRTPPGEDEARTSLPLALYAAAVWKMFRRRCVAVELHHVPSGTVVRHEHTDDSLARKVAQAGQIATDAGRADADHARTGSESAMFEPNPSPLCRWCDVRAHCPEGQAVGPEHPDWAGLPDLDEADNPA